MYVIEGEGVLPLWQARCDGAVVMDGVNSYVWGRGMICDWQAVGTPPLSASELFVINIHPLPTFLRQKLRHIHPDLVQPFLCWHCTVRRT